MSTSSGTLIVRPICAKLTHDTETFGKMDPYCVVTIGGQKHRTVVAHSAGKYPNWQDQLVFTKSSEDIISFEVWDKDTASADDLIGEASLAIATILAKPNYEEWVPLTYKGRKAGEIRVNITFQPSAPVPTVHGIPANMVNMGGYQYAPMYPVPGQAPYPYPYPYPPQSYAQPPPYPQSMYPTLNPNQQPQPYYPPQPGYPPQQGYPPNAQRPPQPYGSIPPPVSQPGYLPSNIQPSSAPHNAPPSYPPQNPPPSYPPQNMPQGQQGFYPYAPK
ncbi:unnamed protein product [Blepharisma stoltei]|uniref:C2 domain-containing protein n=1 Tax=Blepharisma stoltei TaxID=1481888 RepID=A0AAU9IXZ9_9CILI|nr:unnamed protein product [Blepharisma stoltei]